MRRLALAMALLPCPALALDIGLPGGVVTGQSDSPADTVPMPAEPWSSGTAVEIAEGAVRKRAYSVADSTRTTLQLIAPARALLEENGYATTFACADAECGGFDFRFQLDLLPEPAMHVDLGNFRYLLMEREDGTPEQVALLASASATAGFLHVTEVSPASLPTGEMPDVPDVPETPLADDPPDDLIAELVETGHVMLGDLDFGTGSADLGAGSFASLETLAEWLAGNPEARVVLVGHTDAVGSLEANTSLSRQRAASVADRLVDGYGTDAGQLQSAGAGYLSPVASNLTDEGRAANRRVEVVLLSN